VGCCRQWQPRVGAGDGGILDLRVVVDGGAGIGSEAICGSAGWVHKKTVAPSVALALATSLHLPLEGGLHAAYRPSPRGDEAPLFLSSPHQWRVTSIDLDREGDSFYFASRVGRHAGWMGE
jgi:hypothetical protein